MSEPTNEELVACLLESLRKSCEVEGRVCDLTGAAWCWDELWGANDCFCYSPVVGVCCDGTPKTRDNCHRWTHEHPAPPRDKPWMAYGKEELS